MKRILRARAWRPFAYETDDKKEEYDIKFPGPIVYMIVGF
jgi:hypothetical protein